MPFKGGARSSRCRVTTPTFPTGRFAPASGLATPAVGFASISRALAGQLAPSSNHRCGAWARASIIHSPRPMILSMWNHGGDAVSRH